MRGWLPWAGSVLLLLTVGVAVLVYREAGPSLIYEDGEVSMRIVARTPDQITAFYLGRQFSQPAIDRILETCFVTVILHNKTYEVLWLDLDDWRFDADGRNIGRIRRDDWERHWDAVDLPRAQRATFNWTLMPERRDLRLDESVGGSIAIPRQDGVFTMTARFDSGPDRRGGAKTIVFEDLECWREER